MGAKMDGMKRIGLILTVSIFTPISCNNSVDPDDRESDLTPSEIVKIDYIENFFRIYWTQNTKFNFESYNVYESLDAGWARSELIFTSTDQADTMCTVEDVPWDQYRYYRVNIIDTEGLTSVGISERGSSYPRIIFRSNRNGKWDIYSMEIDGSNPQNLTAQLDGAEYSQFTPDGSSVVFVTGEGSHNDDIYIMNSDGSDMKNLTNNPNDYIDPDISSDDSKIVFYRPGNSIITVDRNGANPTQVTENTSKFKFLKAEFSSNPSVLLLTAAYAFYNSFYIFTINTDGTNMNQLTTTGDDEYPAFSPDGSKIVFTSYRNSGEWGEIYVMDVDGSNQTNLTNSPGDDARPRFSPDGMKIVFDSYTDGNMDIYIMNHDGSDQTRLTYDAQYDWYPRFSPDGAFIIFERGDYGEVDICIMNPDGTEKRNLTNIPGLDRNPRIQPRNQ